jgi:ABC-2 type transport system ATP-binding protein
MSLLLVENVVKRFGSYAAVDNISFTSQSGRILGLIGPNGAGKTTTIRMLTNILIPDEGKVYFKGEPISSKHQNLIGYLPEERGLYKKIKVIDQLCYFARLKGLSHKDAMEKAVMWLRKLDISDWGPKKIQELSKGMQQKVQFIVTVLHDPDLLILDEPFSGFDPINTEMMKTIISELKEQGKTIILSTHVMEQAEQLCDDICLINKGKIILSGSLREIKASYGRDTILMEFDGSDEFLSSIKNVQFINKSKNRVEFRLTKESASVHEMLNIAMSSTNLYKFEIVEPALHEIFIDVVSRQEKADEQHI